MGSTRARLRFPLFEQRLPLRFLARRLIRAIVGAAVANTILGERRAPGHYLIVRRVESEAERDDEQILFAESRAAIVEEVEREIAARGIRLRSPLHLEFCVVVGEELAGKEVEEQFARWVGADRVAELLARLAERTEVIEPARACSLAIESEPPGAAVYLDGQPLGLVTPCELAQVGAGEHRVTLALPGYLLHEGRATVDGAAPARYHAILAPEPPMALVEVHTYPARARVTIGTETRESPCTFRLPVGRHRLTATRPDYAPATVEFDLPAGLRALLLPLRLEYAGADRDEVVGRLIVYRPEGPHRPSAEPNPIAEFFHDLERAGAVEPGGEILGERPLRRGVLLLGRPDPALPITPDVRLFDAGNSVSRGCHAWLEIYTDPGTGAAYNTFVLHNESPAGVVVDGRRIATSCALGDDAEVRIGPFRLRIVKETPAPRVEF